MPSNEALSLIADELRALANRGLFYAENIHDRERYEKILSISARMLSVLTRHNADEILALYRDHITHVCPFLGVEAAVFRRDSIMLIKRHDDGLWALPGGLVDVGESWAEAARRELYEETRLKGTEVRGKTGEENLNPEITWEATAIDWRKQIAIAFTRARSPRALPLKNAPRKDAIALF